MSFAFFTTAQEKSITSNNVFLDSDQDGLADAEEKTWETDPFNKDTDKDGYSDGTEVKSGYDPTKSAPGDKIVPEEEKTDPLISTADVQENLTKNLEAKLETMLNDPEIQEEAGVSVDDIQGLINETLSSPANEIQVPEISPEEVKIKKQDFSKLSEEEIKAKENEDFVKYLTAVAYVLSSNSPKPVTSRSDALNVVTGFTSDITKALTNRNPAEVENLAISGEKVLEQMKDVEVPENLADLHIKGLSLAKHMMATKSSLASTPDDPLLDLIKISQLESMTNVVMGYGTELEAMFIQNGFASAESLNQFIGSEKTNPSKK